MKRALVVLLLGSACATVRAQTPPHPSSIVCGIDTLETVERLETLSVWIPGPMPGVSREVQLFREAQLRVVLLALDSMPLLGRRDRQPPVYRQAPVWAGDLTAAQAIVWFQVRDDGHLAGLHLERASGWDAVDAGIQRAVLRADSNRLLQPLPRALRGQPIDLWFAVGFGKPEGNLSLPVARVRMRGPLAARTWPRLLSVGHEIRFPDAAIRAGIGDTLVMEFVVDTTGLAIPETIAPVRASFRDFAEEAARSIRSSRFAPGRIGTCAVPMRFRMATRFFFIGGP